MPELAEVEFYRKQWDCGLRSQVLDVQLRPAKRIYRGVQVHDLRQLLIGSRLRDSRSNGKWMLFRFSRQNYLGIHLGMTGRLLAAPPGEVPGKHDHLVLNQRKRNLIFRDPRLFGRVLFSHGPDLPDWWTRLPPSVTGDQFTIGRLEEICQRHPRVALKALLLDQRYFPGIGNWMADEILWQSRIHPQRRGAALDRPSLRRLYRRIRSISKKAMETIGEDYGPPPSKWLFHKRWKAGFECPACGTPLSRGRIGGRTTSWCGSCQSL